MDNSLLLKATLAMYREAAVQASRGVLRNWPLVLGSIAAYVAFIFCISILGPLGMAGGFVLGLIQVALLTLYYSWISQTVRKERLELRELLQPEWPLFWNIIGVGFLLWIIEYLVSPLQYYPEQRWFYHCVKLGLFLIFNAVPEFIYLHRYDSFYALKEAFNFIRQHWIEWYLPLLVILAPAMLMSWQIVLLPMAAAGADPLLPALVIVSQLEYFLQAQLPGLPLVASIIGVVLANWFMIFRGFLFIDLHGNNRRKRMFREMNK